MSKICRCLQSGECGANTKAGQEEHVGTYWCQFSIKSEGVALKDWLLGGGIKLSYKGFKTDSLMSDVFAKKKLEKYPRVIGVNIVIPERCVVPELLCGSCMCRFFHYLEESPF